MKSIVHPLHVGLKSDGNKARFSIDLTLVALELICIASCQQNPIKVDKLIDFGDVMVNSSEVRRVIISNLSGSLPIKISFDQMSNFSTHPKAISIPPGCQELVNVIFAPRQGGQLRNVLLANQKT